MRRLTKKANADMMSDMKTFTVRELDREPSRILDTCDAEGAVQIRRRDGRVYMMQPKTPAPAKGSSREWIEERRRRRKEIFGDQPIMTRKQAAEFDRMIAGE